MRNDGVHARRASCRACSGTSLVRFLALGDQPLANAFLRSADEARGERRFPLDVYFCESCSLVQLLDVIDPSVLFRDYIYVTGTSETMARHNTAYARAVVDRHALGPDDLVVEVASNDGSLLKCFRDLGVRTLGIEPATNVAALASRDGIETVNEFFDLEQARALRARYGQARAIVANNVLAHVDDTLGFLEGCRTLIEPDGVVVVEVPYLRELLDRLEYDTIYHEHLCYFSVTTLLRLFEGAGMVVTAVDHVPVHGGSLRVTGTPRNGRPAHATAVAEMARAEHADGLTRLETWQTFARAVERNREALLGLLRQLRRDGGTLAAYGAPAKGNTLLNYCGIGPDLVAFTVDRSPLKVGRLTPGTHIPVLDVKMLLERAPSHVLVLAWNFADEIMQQQAEYRSHGGRFVLPIPEPRVIG